MPPLISCIVPAFNAERHLGDTLNSILAQTYHDLEIIVADDGSTDATANLVAAYSDRIRFVSQPNSGPSAARNLGVRAARGEYVAFLDQDDLWHPEKLSRQLTRFKKRQELDLCVTHLQIFWDPGLESEQARFRDHRLEKPLPGYITGTLLAKRAIFQRVGLFNPALRYGDAMDWFLRAAERGAIQELMPDVLLLHRMHETNLSRREASASRNEFLHILKASLVRRRSFDKANNIKRSR